ncbi:MerR family transcriptional regulator [Paenibacillus donghaensis]|uniref:MerR family transcriptional regulator n=1 Tax=Paenibacillus donghaensis TaxID=414771 RepID=A0A2Z2KLA2_9BACL|nr:MerR family transcriptional regulator [Paenibacillus donghaensis]ASA20731.1 MerR family transcriptional regulator [Paenibacillus donghaensis]
MYTVNDVSEMLGMSKHTIRYYTDQGLVPSLQRDKHNNRLLDETSVNWLIGVRYLKNCGMSLSDIREYNELCLIGNETIEKRWEIIMNQKKSTAEQLIEVQNRIKFLDDKLTLYEKIITNQVADSTNPSKWDTAKPEVKI